MLMNGRTCGKQVFAVRKLRVHFTSYSLPTAKFSVPISERGKELTLHLTFQSIINFDKDTLRPTTLCSSIASLNAQQQQQSYCTHTMSEPSACVQKNAMRAISYFPSVVSHYIQQKQDCPPAYKSRPPVSRERAASFLCTRLSHLSVDS